MAVATWKFDTLLLPGMDRAAGHARRWLEDLLGEHPAAGDAAVCTSELVTNALKHTKSKPDGQVRVDVRHSERVVRVEGVDDGGARSVPHLARVRAGASCGRGLLIVAFLASSWGIERRGDGHVVWFELWRPAA